MKKHLLLASLFLASALSLHAAEAQAIQGQNVTVTVAVESGTLPFSYQWRKDGTDIPGATDSNLVLASVQAKDAGTYSVRVTNAAGNVISDNASLTLVIPPGKSVTTITVTSAKASTAKIK